MYTTRPVMLIQQAGTPVLLKSAFLGPSALEEVGCIDPQQVGDAGSSITHEVHAIVAIQNRGAVCAVEPRLQAGK